MCVVLLQVSGTPERPRLAVYRSNNHIYAQVCDQVCSTVAGVRMCQIRPAGSVCSPRNGSLWQLRHLHKQSARASKHCCALAAVIKRPFGQGAHNSPPTGFQMDQLQGTAVVDSHGRQLASQKGTRARATSAALTIG